MSELKAVLFDLDDTLFDHRHSSRCGLQLFQERYKEFAAVPLDELELLNLSLLNTIHAEVLSGAITVDEARLRRFGILFRSHSINLTDKELLEASDLYRRKYLDSRRATPGAIELLKELRVRGLTIGVVTNNVVEEQLDKLRDCGLNPLVDSVTISEAVGVAKPHPRIFEIGLEGVGCAATETVMIGDSWTSDVLGARSAGIRPIWYNCYDLEIPDKNVPEIGSFEDTAAALAIILRA